MESLKVIQGGTERSTENGELKFSCWTEKKEDLQTEQIIRDNSLWDSAR